jgi:Leucine-rich repeat (LRR) protein
LQQLYIINFKSFVTKIPKAISNFQTLTFLALYNNKILRLPPELSSMVSLKKLYIDMNPVTVLTPTINMMTKLDTLGIAKTLIADVELSRIKQQLPNCKILLK